MPPHKHYRCRFSSAILPAWLPVAKRPQGLMLLYHLSQQHPDQVGPYLERMRTEDIATVAAEAFACTSAPGSGNGSRPWQPNGGCRIVRWSRNCCGWRCR
jgi:hypothetical protein